MIRTVAEIEKINREIYLININSLVDIVVKTSIEKNCRISTVEY
jgi:hypothetical protein